MIVRLGENDNYLEDALKNATIFINGKKIDPKGSSVHYIKNQEENI